MSTTIAVIEKLLADTRVCLKIQPRNAYQAENAHRDNMERLKKAREGIGHFSGDYVDRLRLELEQLERAVKDASLPPPNPIENLLYVHVGDDVDEQAEDEAALAAWEMEKKHEGRKKKPKPKQKLKSKTKALQQNPEDSEKIEMINDTHPSHVGPPLLGSGDEHPESANVADEVLKVIAMYSDCQSTDIPQDAIGAGRCMPVLNTPLAHLVFDSVVDFDGHMCKVRVTLHRVVVIALTFGEPPSASIEAVENDDGEAAACTDTDKDHDAFSEAERDAEEATYDEDTLSSPLNDDDDNTVEGGAQEEMDDTTVDQLTRQLVAEYDALQEEKKRVEDGNKGLPQDVTLKLRSSLSSFTALPWVIVMCHGGFFAGGVFIDGKPVVHKVFQRYVVRKKQGGKQSSNEKEGGSYGSIGSQIRRAQEIKWRIDVRDVLMRWRNYIDAAMLVLYVAPGPKNRNVLTDFSALPAAASEHGDRTVSPISLKDPRVHKAPLTTHRPSFQEVQRIYNTVSTCNVEYLLYTNKCADSHRL
uniref:VLRF1 domain-containing protein n=1 Tax=Trypanosoma congolense (strain IL3000) TaxID=1068625 RepID=G0UU74_TRYCI|nr:conserved hypothetical protein [Trypanosoma congolense IL3000]